MVVDHGADPASGRAVSAPRTGRRIDPGRRDRIIDACLEVIAEGGVTGTSHRRVAVVADVPLGSMTYHFAGMDELLRAAFTRFSERVADRFERRMSAAHTLAEAKSAVVSLICDDVFAHRQDLALTLELYTLAAREPTYRTITEAWMTRSRQALARHFDDPTCRQLDALIEGLTLHRALSTDPFDVSVVVGAVDSITTPAEPGAPGRSR